MFNCFLSPARSVVPTVRMGRTSEIEKWSALHFALGDLFTHGRVGPRCQPLTMHAPESVCRNGKNATAKTQRVCGASNDNQDLLCTAICTEPIGLFNSCACKRANTKVGHGKSVASPCMLTRKPCTVSYYLDLAHACVECWKSEPQRESGSSYQVFDND